MSTEIKKQSDSLDMLLVSLPWWDMDIPHCGPAVLKGVADSAGYKLQVWDSNVDLLDKFCNGDRIKYFNIKEYFIGESDYQHQWASDVVREFYKHVIDKILKTKTRYVSFSVFSIWTQEATMDLAKMLKERDPNIQLVVGGRGLTAQCHSRIHRKLTSGEKLLTFADVLIKRKLVDYTILADGEDALIDLLSDQLNKLDTTWKTSKNNLDYPFSSFDDIDLTKYQNFSKFQLPVVSSKGCVRSCDFCDVGAQMKRFQSKDGKRLAEEMIYLSEKYKVYNFTLSDSIANGNMKELTNACRHLTDYNSSCEPDKKIRWAGNWISRPPGSVKESFYDLLASSGCESLIIGAESGSNKVLEAMNKKTTVEGLYFDIEQFSRLGIVGQLNLLNGHWAESFEDFEQHIEMMVRLGPYIADGTITQWIPHQFSLLRNTPASNFEHSGMEASGAEFTYFWHTDKNPNLTIKARAARSYIVFKISERYRALKIYGKSNLIEVSSGIQGNTDRWIEFYKDKLDFDNYEPCPSIELMDNNILENYLTTLYKKIYTICKLKLVVESNHCNGAPNLFVKVNNELVFENLLSQGSNQFEFEFDYNYISNNILEIGMNNKGAHDTQVDEHGNIIADKNIIIKSLMIDQLELLDHPEIFYNKSIYKEENTLLPTARPGFWKNSSITFDWSGPFWEWLLMNIPYSELDRAFGSDNLDEDLINWYNNIKQLPY